MGRLMLTMTEKTQPLLGVQTFKKIFQMQYLFMQMPAQPLSLEGLTLQVVSTKQKESSRKKRLLAMKLEQECLLLIIG